MSPSGDKIRSASGKERRRVHPVSSTQTPPHGTQPIAHPALQEWVAATVALTQPDSVFWCDGSEAEKDFLYAEAVREGVLAVSYTHLTLPTTPYV